MHALLACICMRASMLSPLTVPPAGEKGQGTSGKALHFKGSGFHRIIPQFMIQGGDFTRGR